MKRIDQYEQDLPFGEPRKMVEILDPDGERIGIKENAGPVPEGYTLQKLLGTL